jgi:hypothetical protein
MAFFTKKMNLTVDQKAALLTLAFFVLTGSSMIYAMKFTKKPSSKSTQEEIKEILGSSNEAANKKEEMEKNDPSSPAQGAQITPAQTAVSSALKAVGAIAKGTPTAAPSTQSKYPWHNNIQTSWFYVGEPSDASNGYIPNSESAWDGNWLLHYGGVDNPTPKRIAPYYYPSFKPKENPFYFALPYSDLTDAGARKTNAKNIPWWTGEPGSGVSVVKNRWIEISYNGKVAYAQWEDVGPNKTDDFNYVFGTAAPSNTFGVHAGLDISPATRDFLNCDNGKVNWRFIDAKDVPAGPWKNVVTTSQISW